MSWLSNAGSQLTGIALSQSPTMNADKVSNPGVIGPGKYTDISVPNAGSQTVQASTSPSAASSDFGSNLSGIGSLLGGTASVIGGILNYHQQKKANKLAQKQFEANLAFQKDQFYNAIQHRVVDASKAGVHPLAALGVNPHGSASPTAHVQSATGLGHALQNATSSINSYFDNVIKTAQLDLLASQVAANKAISIKHIADANRSNADTDFTRKEIANYHVYRGINSAINAVGAVGKIFRPPVVRPTTHYNTNYNPMFQKVY